MFQKTAKKNFTPTEQAFIAWLATPESARTIRTQEHLADILGIHRMTLSRWKKREDISNAVTARKMQAVGVDGLSKVIDALVIRASKVSGEGLKDANEAGRIFLRWFYDKDF